MGISRKLIRAAAVVPLVVGGLAVLTPGAAEAATCGQSWSDKDKSGYGNGIGSAGTVPLRTGIYADCPVRTPAGNGYTLWYHCYRINSYGNSWTHLRVNGTNISGWVYSGNLSDGGSTVAC